MFQTNKCKKVSRYLFIYLFTSFTSEGVLILKNNPSVLPSKTASLFNLPRHHLCIFLFIYNLIINYNTYSDLYINTIDTSLISVFFTKTPPSNALFLATWRISSSSPLTENFIHPGVFRFPPRAVSSINKSTIKCV